jgi:hypothetical protein
MQRVTAIKRERLWLHFAKSLRRANSLRAQSTSLASRLVTDRDRVLTYDDHIGDVITSQFWRWSTACSVRLDRSVSEISDRYGWAYA